MTTTLPAAVPLAEARRINRQVWTDSSRLLYAGRIDEFLGYWHQDASYQVAYPIPGMPASVQGHDALRAMFSGFGAAAASIDVENVIFHQTDNPQVAIVEEQMSALLHDGSTYQNTLIIRVEFRDGLIAAMFEYYGEKAHENLLHRLGFVA